MLVLIMQTGNKKKQTEVPTFWEDSCYLLLRTWLTSRFVYVCTILIILKGTVLWHYVYSPCCATIRVIHHQNIFISPNWKSVPFKHQFPSPLCSQPLTMTHPTL